MRVTVKNNHDVWLEWIEITLKKSQRLDIACALTLFALSGSAHAATVASDNTAITGADPPSAHTLVVSPSSFTSEALTFDVMGNAGQRQPDEPSNFADTSSDSPRTDSHLSLWLLLIVAAVFGLISERFHRRSFNQ